MQYLIFYSCSVHKLLEKRDHRFHSDIHKQDELDAEHVEVGAAYVEVDVEHIEVGVEDDTEDAEVDDEDDSENVEGEWVEDSIEDVDEEEDELVGWNICIQQDQGHTDWVNLKTI